MSIRPRHLLVVERDRRVGSYVTQALRAEGYQVDWATGDEEALASVRRGSPELIVFDASRPDARAVALARALLADDPDVPLLLVTAGLPEEDAVGNLARARLVKPFRLDDLLAQVAALLAG